MPVMFVISVAGVSGGTFSWAIVQAVVVVIGLIIAGRIMLNHLERLARPQ